MPLTAMKRLRLLHSMTQKEIAAKVGVSQPNYQRWESGTAPVPEAKLQRLAKVLHTTREELLGQPRPFEFLGRTGSDDDHTFYGDIAVHFTSGAHPLLLPVSLWERNFLHHQLHGGRTYITVKSLDNRAVLMRRDAIVDLYASSEEFEEYGPERDSYYGYLDPMAGPIGVMPEHTFWSILEHSDYLDDLPEDERFDPQDVEKVLKFLSEQSSEDREDYLSRAQTVEWQLPSGKIRREIPPLDDDLDRFNYHAWWGDAESVIDDTPFFHFTSDGYNRSVFINSRAVEWISLPIHRLERVAMDEAESSLSDD